MKAHLSRLHQTICWLSLYEVAMVVTVCRVSNFTAAYGKRSLKRDMTDRRLHSICHQLLLPTVWMTFSASLKLKSSLSVDWQLATPRQVAQRQVDKTLEARSHPWPPCRRLALKMSGASSSLLQLSPAPSIRYWHSYYVIALTHFLPFLMAMVNASLHERHLPVSQKKAFLTPLLKKSSFDICNLKTNRPVSNLFFVSKLQLSWLSRCQWAYAKTAVSLQETSFNQDCCAAAAVGLFRWPR